MWPMFQIALWATLAWLTALVYSHYWYKHAASQDPKKFGVDSFGVKQTLLMVLWLVFTIYLMGFLSGTWQPSRPPGDSPPQPRPLSWMMILFLLVFGLLVARELWANLRGFIRAVCQGTWLEVILSVFAPLVIVALVAMQVFRLSEFSNNLFMVLMCIITVPVVYYFRRSGLVTIFMLIMLLDVYLVWMAQSGISKPGGNWYTGMITSPLMQHLPLPVMIRVDNRLLGGGDIFFMVMAVIYARRAYSVKAALLVGALMTAPLLVLPYLYQVWPNLPRFWPYTIFIVPWALLVALLAWRRDRKAQAAAN